MLKRSYAARHHYAMAAACRSDSTDSQFTDTEEELTFLEACMDCDEDALYDIIQDGLTYEQVNERDKSGRTGLSHASGNGFLSILELLAEVEELDPNLADNDGNTPLIFAAQAGHEDVVSYLIHHIRHVRIDQTNKLGFTALKKAAIQGRTKCAKLLLFAGANPNRRDYGRGLCAEEWARFCGRTPCAEAISKYIHSKKYFFKKTFILTREKWSSEPDLMASKRRAGGDGDKAKGSWLTRHLSMKKKKRGGATSGHQSSIKGPNSPPTVSETTKAGSAPELNFPDQCSPDPGRKSGSSARRPSCFDNVVAINIIPKLRLVGEPYSPIPEDSAPKIRPPQILETDFDSEMEAAVV